MQSDGNHKLSLRKVLKVCSAQFQVYGKEALKQHKQTKRHLIALSSQKNLEKSLKRRELECGLVVIANGAGSDEREQIDAEFRRLENYDLQYDHPLILEKFV